MDLTQDPEFQALLEAFRAELTPRLATIRAALAEGDLPTVAQTAHKIAGCAEAYGFNALGQTARRCDHQIRGGGQAEESQRLAEALQSEMLAVMNRSKAA